MKGKKYLLGVKVDPDLMAWLRRAAAKERVTVSHIVRRQLLAGFEARHAKYVPRDPVEGTEGTPETDGTQVT